MESVVDAFSFLVVAVTVIRGAAIGAYYNIIIRTEFFAANYTACADII